MAAVRFHLIKTTGRVWTHPGSLGHHQEGPSAPFLDARLGINSAYGAPERSFCRLFDQPMAYPKLELVAKYNLDTDAPGIRRFCYSDRTDLETSI